MSKKIFHLYIYGHFTIFIGFIDARCENKILSSVKTNNQLNIIIRLESVILSEYFSLTKPRIIILLTVTGIGGFFIPQPNFDGVSILDIMVFVYVGYASAGGAMAINNYIDRDIDALMERTKNRPSVGDDALSRNQILSFGFGLAGSGIYIAYLYFNLLT
ncbi:MAG: UbiA family prenyltransferase, partial [Candidatus Heimdallarchaeota archaeon]|nr:UbiA family prenyltransferase [Candidatus Heimdallarchaeota archaeon]